jgi:hypothetical protein
VTSLESKQSDAGRLLDWYTCPRRHYAFKTYDHLYGQSEPLSPGDILLANLLSLRLSWREVVPLFAEGDGPPQRLRRSLDDALNELARVRAFEEHADVEELEASLPALRRANDCTQHVPGWTSVTVSKVLHRRLPHIVPIMDSRVRSFYGLRKPQHVREALFRDLKANRSWLSVAVQGRRTPDDRPLSLLRAADILIWTQLPSGQPGATSPA